MKSVTLYVMQRKEKHNFHHWTNEIENKHTWFSWKIFLFNRKWKIKKTLVLDVWSATYLKTFWIKQGMLLFLHVSNVSGMCRGMRLRLAFAIACLICWSLLLSFFVLKIFGFNWKSLFVRYFGYISRFEQFVQLWNC